MHSDNFDISTYFKRINYTGPAAADTSTLHALMRHQLFSVPFENLDVQAGKIVSLAPDDIADKVLKKGRGGYCYEVNGLFAMALEALGILTVSWRRARCSTRAAAENPYGAHRRGGEPTVALRSRVRQLRHPRANGAGHA
jgi:arylamine N-acetyltransferase